MKTSSTFHLSVNFGNKCWVPHKLTLIVVSTQYHNFNVHSLFIEIYSDLSDHFPETQNQSVICGRAEIECHRGYWEAQREQLSQWSTVNNTFGITLRLRSTNHTYDCSSFSFNTTAIQHISRNNWFGGRDQSFVDCVIKSVMCAPEESAGCPKEASLQIVLFCQQFSRIAERQRPTSWGMGIFLKMRHQFSCTNKIKQSPWQMISSRAHLSYVYSYTDILYTPMDNRFFLRIGNRSAREATNITFNSIHS